MPLPDALNRVSHASGFTRKQLKDFRDNLSRGGDRVPQFARPSYDEALGEMQRDSPSIEWTLELVSGLAKFVGKSL